MNHTEALIAQLVDLEARKAHIDETITQIKAALLANHQPGDTITFNGEPVLKVAVKRTFKEDIARQVLTAEQLQTVTVPKIDPAAVKAHLGTDTWAACCHTGDPYITKASR